MGIVTIQHRTTKDPITLIGEEARYCWGSNISSPEKNYKRGIECLESGHGRTFEFPDVYIVLEGYSAKTIRELYTHIGGSPTRLQASTRYIDYKDFNYILPESIANNKEAVSCYIEQMIHTSKTMEALERCGVPKEDISLVLPFAMETKMVGKYNLRTLIDMSHQRECSRAYWEFRELFRDIRKALCNYSKQWEYIVNTQMMPKCEYLGYCPEKYSCGRKSKKVTS